MLVLLRLIKTGYAYPKRKKEYSKERLKNLTVSA
jgi:hypothetical protein